jgi:hypothetical protein
VVGWPMRGGGVGCTSREERPRRRWHQARSSQVRSSQVKVPAGAEGGEARVGDGFAVGEVDGGEVRAGGSEGLEGLVAHLR